MRPSFESSSSNLEHNDSQGNVPTNRGDFNVLQQHLDLVSNRHNTPFDQQRFFVSSQRRYRPAERVGKRELQRISARLKRNREMLDTLSTPQIKYSLARTLTDEEKTAIERMDKVNKAVKAFLGKHLPPEMIATYHRAKAIELWKEQVMQAPSEGSLQQVSKLESDLKKASSIYTELSKPVWEQLETLKDKRATVRRQLEDLRVQESLLKRIFCDAKNTLSLHDQIKWKLLGSSKSEASEGHSVPLREIQEELNSVNMLIKRAQKHEIALTDKIKKGHDYLFYQAIELKANTHCFFAPQQMQEYRPEEEGRIRVTVDLLNSCAASTTAMVLSDIDSSYSEKAGREQIVKECRKEGMAFSTSWWANARDKRRNYNNPSREADIINRLQNAVTYTLGGISPYQKSLEYNGKKLGRVASLHRREGSNLPAAHSVVIDDIKLLEGKTYAFIRDPLINNLAYRIRWDDLEEVRDPMGFIPTALR